jgi:hypothetical protein
LFVLLLMFVFCELLPLSEPEAEPDALPVVDAELSDEMPLWG